MKGFLKRDGSLLWANYRLYIVFILVIGGVSLNLERFSSFAMLYVSILLLGSEMNLFAFDDANHWQGYAAAAPNGRRAMVDARYSVSLLLSLIVAALTAVLALMGKESPLGAACMYGGLSLVYGAIVLPVCYRFGGVKGRTVMILIVAIFTGVAAMGITAASLATGFGAFLAGGASVIVLLLGLAAMGISYRVSRAIVAKKEF